MWRRLPTDDGSADRHIALSDALARAANVPTVWWHTTNSETLIFGAGQPSEEVDHSRDRDQSVKVLRRKSGGGVVYAGPGVWGLDVAIPLTATEWRSDILEAYRWLGQIWVVALNDLDVDARTISVAEARAGLDASDTCDGPVRSICFATMSPYEVYIGQRKLVGFAQIRRRAAYVLQSGTHVRFPFSRVASLMTTSGEDALSNCLQKRVTDLETATKDSVDMARVQDAFERALTRSTGCEIKTGDWSPKEMDQAA